MAKRMTTGASTTAEHKRLRENSADSAPWHRWGPYLSERQWGTVREDYSPVGTAWDYFPHDHARSRAYRWGEDGIMGISDAHQILCFSVAMWNHRDPILKERLFGLANGQGNHGEDVKEVYHYLDNTPSHSYMRGLYKYPQTEYPYNRLVEENARRSRLDREFELVDTGIFDEDRYFDVIVEYAKETPDDIYIRITVHNRGPDEAELTLLPQVFFRNRWSWTAGHKECSLREDGVGRIVLEDRTLGAYSLLAESAMESLFTENDTDHQRLFNVPNPGPYVKDAFHRCIVNGETDAVNPDKSGTKACFVGAMLLMPGEQRTLRVRLCKGRPETLDVVHADAIFDHRRQEADQFYESLTPGLVPEIANIQRQAFAGLLWNKQFYHYDVRTWHRGDPLQPLPPAGREEGRNHSWDHFDAADVLSMPDKWEYPWFAAWDLAFHCIPLSLLDPKFAKEQLTLLLREWYMHPSGQIPAYEWSFSDVNPPVHAWAAWRVYTIERRATGKGDKSFLEGIFHKLLLNFTWWVNRKDAEGNNVFEGGFLGLDNIGVFDRNQPLPSGDVLEQSDGTSWMGMFCLSMLTIALELAVDNPVYEDVATKFMEHFFYIAEAMNRKCGDHINLYDDDDGFYYDVVHNHQLGTNQYVKVRSMVGLIPIFAVTTLESQTLSKFPGFKRRLNWFLEHRPECIESIASLKESGKGRIQIFSLVDRAKLEKILVRVLDQDEFLSPFGIRALSKIHKTQPYTIQLDGHNYTVDYEPAESTSGLFGGNSNWRGPVWFPPNYLMIEALQNLGFYYGDSLKVEMPTGSGIYMNLAEVAAEIEMRLISLFAPYVDGRPCLQGAGPYGKEAWKDLVLFNEYFDGDTGRGLGASHQTGWTGLVAKLIQQAFYTAADQGDTSSIQVDLMKKPLKKGTRPGHVKKGAPRAKVAK